jgi:hypothetical protein
MSVRALMLVSLLLAASPVFAADSTNRFALRGVGLADCEHFLKAMKERKENVLVAGGWLEGYITAVNQFTPNTFDIAPGNRRRSFSGSSPATASATPKRDSSKSSSR